MEKVISKISRVGCRESRQVCAEKSSFILKFII